jgi:hypothetical protein
MCVCVCARVVNALVVQQPEGKDLITLNSLILFPFLVFSNLAGQQGDLAAPGSH